MKNCYGKGDLELYDRRLDLKVDGWKLLPVISLREAAILANSKNDFIAGCKKVGAAIPNYLKGPPPIVSYTYTRTIGGKIFNNRRAVEELDVENGTEGMQCSCSSSEYKYDLCGHVLTGDLSIIRDVKLRHLIRKGPVFREQNNIDWEVNLKNCKASVSKYVKSGLE